MGIVGGRDPGRSGNPLALSSNQQRASMSSPAMSPRLTAAIATQGSGPAQAPNQRPPGGPGGRRGRGVPPPIPPAGIRSGVGEPAFREKGGQGISPRRGATHGV